MARPRRAISSTGNNSPLRAPKRALRRRSISESDKQKVMTPGSWEISKEDVLEGLSLPSGSRPRIYGLFGSQILGPKSLAMLDNYISQFGEADFYWTNDHSMNNIGDWMIRPASVRSSMRRRESYVEWKPEGDWYVLEVDSSNDTFGFVEQQGDEFYWEASQNGNRVSSGYEDSFAMAKEKSESALSSLGISIVVKSSRTSMRRRSNVEFGEWSVERFHDDDLAVNSEIWTASSNLGGITGEIVVSKSGTIAWHTYFSNGLIGSGGYADSIDEAIEKMKNSSVFGLAWKRSSSMLRRAQLGSLRWSPSGSFGGGLPGGQSADLPEGGNVMIMESPEGGYEVVYWADSMSAPEVWLTGRPSIEEAKRALDKVREIRQAKVSRHSMRRKSNWVPADGEIGLMYFEDSRGSLIGQVDLEDNYWSVYDLSTNDIVVLDEGNASSSEEAMSIVENYAQDSRVVSRSSMRRRSRNVPSYELSGDVIEIIDFDNGWTVLIERDSVVGFSWSIHDDYGRYIDISEGDYSTIDDAKADIDHVLADHGLMISDGTTEKLSKNSSMRRRAFEKTSRGGWIPFGGVGSGIQEFWTEDGIAGRVEQWATDWSYQIYNPESWDVQILRDGVASTEEEAKMVVEDYFSKNSRNKASMRRRASIKKKAWTRIPGNEFSGDEAWGYYQNKNGSDWALEVRYNGPQSNTYQWIVLKDGVQFAAGFEDDRDNALDAAEKSLPWWDNGRGFYSSNRGANMNRMREAARRRANIRRASASRTRRKVSYNGWTNWDTWNASLWINNEEGIYRAAVETQSPAELRDLVVDWGITGDGFDVNAVNWDEVWTDNEFGTTASVRPSRRRRASMRRRTSKWDDIQIGDYVEIIPVEGVHFAEYEGVFQGFDSRGSISLYTEKSSTVLLKADSISDIVKIPEAEWVRESKRSNPRAARMRRRANVFTYSHGGYDFEWHGGEYIEVSKNGKPLEVINVWDYSSGSPDIEKSQADFESECIEWISEEDNLANLQEAEKWSSVRRANQRGSNKNREARIKAARRRARIAALRKKSSRDELGQRAYDLGAELSDGVTENPLSGEWADELTIPALANRLGVDPYGEEISWLLDDFEDGWYSKFGKSSRRARIAAMRRRSSDWVTNDAATSGTQKQFSNDVAGSVWYVNDEIGWWYALEQNGNVLADGAASSRSRAEELLEKQYSQRFSRASSNRARTVAMRRRAETAKEFIDRLVSNGTLSPAARDMDPQEVIDQYNEANALDEEDEDFLRLPKSSRNQRGASMNRGARIKDARRKARIAAIRRRSDSRPVAPANDLADLGGEEATATGENLTDAIREPLNKRVHNPGADERATQVDADEYDAQGGRGAPLNPEIAPANQHNLASRKPLQAMRLADLNLELGTISPDEKYAKVAEYEELPAEVLEDRVKTAEEIISKLPKQAAQKTASGRVPKPSLAPRGLPSRHSSQEDSEEPLLFL